MSFATFSETDYAQILECLGMSFTPRNRQTVVDQCVKLQAMGTPYVERVKETVDQILKLKKDIIDAAPFASRSFQSGGSTTAQHFRGERLHHPRVAGRSLVSQLSSMLQVPPDADIFATGSAGFGSVVMG